MIIFPAIDIKDGTCVRLSKGDINTVEQVASDPIETAKGFKEAGATWIHIVDIDGAFSGKRVNSEIVIEIAKQSGLKVEVGGGIRTMQDIDFYIENGVDRVILGSVALSNQQLVVDAVKKYGYKVAIGIDARNGKVAAEGWVKDSEVDYIDLALKMEKAGVKCIIFTDIARDGMLSGPNIEQLMELDDATTCNIIASGGVTNIYDIKKLRDAGIYGAICGRSIYRGTLDLKEAIEVCKS
ncbi:MAG: 1-(5-phosphoribosyl)-5-[(5-phosphoribosylamino)methylideneamino]imidazole-4-carboxamide isomerase [Acutalibacteraceae bacterium]|jgi:phosphoribosylformimino-5-aminoimidazole carboxamide ribotide isomerase|nr:1-(5-phosphoribosyl)-5-[(5-phosphoribosylamino)methylideneamino]imidazole-4-carboxamide isomerase [Clostridiales bacterium]